MTSDVATTTSPAEHFTLEHQPVGRLKGTFFVPRYQRGYRWDKADVRRLLDDLKDFITAPEPTPTEATYSLQPIVIKRHGEDPASGVPEWELIDGQQRLTTLFIIFRYLSREGWLQNSPPFSLRYDTRERSREYLEALGEDPSADQMKADDNIDFHHLYNAYQSVADWFNQKLNGAQERMEYAKRLLQALYSTVRVIRYEAPLSANATDLFTRLNVGRIALTDAELVKAALLLRLGKSLSSERAYETAAQWDLIEQDLQREELWAFISGMNADSDAQTCTRISLLLDTLADIRGKAGNGPRPRYFTFETLRQSIDEDPAVFWQQVVDLHAHILGWYRDVETHNSIGFLIAVSRKPGNRFIEIARHSLQATKSSLKRYLKGRIREELDLSKEQLLEISYEDDAGKRKINDALLLANILTYRNKERFPFDRHNRHKWSLEHIHAQNAEGPNTIAYWREWLSQHSLALDSLLGGEKAPAVRDLKARIHEAQDKLSRNNPNDPFKKDQFLALSTEILDTLSIDSGPDHGLGNMALLSSEHNSYLNNAAFEVKRQRIVKSDEEGEYIPVCTRNVFLKYYSKSRQPHYWSEEDRVQYLQKMEKLLEPYLSNGGAST